MEGGKLENEGYRKEKVRSRQNLRSATIESSIPESDWKSLSNSSSNPPPRSSSITSPPDRVLGAPLTGAMVWPEFVSMVKFEEAGSAEDIGSEMPSKVSEGRDSRRS
jgi:hypothetical protein